MLLDNLGLDKDSNIELFFKDTLIESDALGGIEALEIILGLRDERQGLVLILQQNSHLDLFSLQVKYSITEMDQD